MSFENPQQNYSGEKPEGLETEADQYQGPEKRRESQTAEAGERPEGLQQGAEQFEKREGEIREAQTTAPETGTAEGLMPEDKESVVPSEKSRVVPNPEGEFEGPAIEQERTMHTDASTPEHAVQEAVRVQQEVNEEAKYKKEFESMLGRSLTPADQDSFKKYVESQKRLEQGIAKEQPETEQETVPDKDLAA